MGKRKRGPVQGRLPFTSRGGYREGAGRPKGKGKRNVPHRTRGELKASHPVHVTIRMVKGLESLRRRRVYRVVERSLIAASDRFGFRINLYSVQSNHLHLIVEVENRTAMSKGMQGLKTRLAKALNKHWQRSGPIFADRYAEHVLRKLLEVRNAVRYVLNNAVKHGCLRPGTLDRFSSGKWFDGWMNWQPREPSPLPGPRTWLLGVGWLRHYGRLAVGALG